MSHPEENIPLKTWLTPWSKATAALVLVFMAITFPLWTGRAHEAFDAYQLYAPYFSLLAHLLPSEGLLLWDPWSNGGMPSFAEPQFGAFSPVILFFTAILGSSQQAFCYYWLCIWFLSGAGILCLGRYWRVPPWVAFVCALSLLFSGFFIGHAQHTSIIYSMAFFPFMIWRFEVAMEKRSALAALQTGVIWGLSALGGYPVFTICQMMLLGLWSLTGPLMSNQTSPLKSRIKLLLIAALIGVVVLSPSYFAFFYEGKGFSYRSEAINYHTASTTNPLHPGALSTFFSPFLVLIQGINGLWPLTDMTASSVYLGAVVTLLFMVALTQIRGRNWWFFLAAVFFMLAAFGCYTPVYEWFYHGFPPIRFSRQAAMLRGFSIFLILILALKSGTALREKTTAWSGRLAIAFAILATLGMALVGLIYHSVTNKGYPLYEIAGHLVLTWAGVALIAGFGFRAALSKKLIPICLITIAIFDASVTAYATRFFWMQSVDLKRGEDEPKVPGYPTQVSIARSLANENNEQYYHGIPALQCYTAFKNSYHLALCEEPLTAQFAASSKRFWFSAEAPVFPMSAATLKQYKTRVRELEGRPVLIRHTREELLKPTGTAGANPEAIRHLSAAENLPIEVIAYHPNVFKFSVNAPADGWLCVTDRWSRSWISRVNGKEIPMEGGNFVFRLTPVRAGMNEIEYRFRPIYLYPLLAASWGAVLIVGGASLWNLRRRQASL